MDYLDRQIRLEHRYSKRNIRKVIFAEINNETTVKLAFYYAREAVLEWANSTPEFNTDAIRKNLIKSMPHEDVADMLVDIMIPVLADDKPIRIQQLAGSALRWFDTTKLDTLAVRDKVTITTELICILAEQDLLEIEFDDYNNAYVYSNVQLDKATFQYINQLMYVPPSIIKPMAIKDKHDDGSYTKVASGCLLGHYLNYNTPHICTDALNLYQKQLMALDMEVLAEPEVPSKELDTVEKQQQFELLSSNSKRVYEDIFQSTDGVGKFYFRYAYDGRGRLYTLGYHINLQSSEYKKALINFGKGEVVDVEEIR